MCRAHGLLGEVAVKTFDPGSETLFHLRRVLLRTKEGKEKTLAVQSARATAKETLLGLKGIYGREKAAALVGATVLAFREDLGALKEGQYFLGDLIGLAAVDERGNVLGTVEGLVDAGEVPNLVIRREAQELLVPFAEEFVPKVDLNARRVVVRPLEYS